MSGVKYGLTFVVEDGEEKYTVFDENESEIGYMVSKKEAERLLREVVGLDEIVIDGCFCRAEDLTQYV